MKKKVSLTSMITGISFIIYALALAVGPNTLYPGCPAEKMMKCTQSLNVLFWIGIILGVIGIVNFFINADIYRLVASVVGIIAGIFAFLIPAVIIGACSMATMPCRALTFPVIYVLSGIFIAVNVINGILLLRARKTQKDSE